MAAEWPAGIACKGSGLIDDVEIISPQPSTTHTTADKKNAGLFGIVTELATDEFVVVSNTKINLQLKSEYDPNYPNETEPMRVCGIVNGCKIGGVASSIMFSSVYDLPGTVIVIDCNIIASGIEDTADPNDPNDDGAGLRVAGIWVPSNSTVELLGETFISTSRTSGSHAADGNEFSLLNENGTMAVDFNDVTYDPNKTSGTISQLVKVQNITQDANYVYIQDAIDDPNTTTGDIIKVLPGYHFGGIDFDGKAVTITGTDPNDWDVVESTIVDGGDGPSVLFDSSEDSNSVLKGLTIKNAGTYGIVCQGSSPVITDCIIEDSGSYGIYLSSSGSSDIERNKIRNNVSVGVQATGVNVSASIKNNWIYNNGFKGINTFLAPNVTIKNNTIVNNTSYGISSFGTAPTISNCIIWGNSDDLYGCSATYSCIEDLFDVNDANFVGSINSDPLFFNPGNYNFHISPLSPCLDAGDPNGDYSSEKDIDMDTRATDVNGVADGNSIVDIGADEIDRPNIVYNIYQDIWCYTIQGSIDDANDGDEIIIYPATYQESINFGGKAITLRGIDPNDWNVVETTVIDGNNLSDAVTFDGGEGPNSILTGVTVSDAYGGIYCGGTSPVISKCIITGNSNYGVGVEIGLATITNNKIFGNSGYGIVLGSTEALVIENNWIYDTDNPEGNSYGIYFYDANATAIVRNNTIVNNDYGIYLDSGTAPTISNCILWDNSDDLYDCSATYSCIEDGDSGTGNIGGDANDPCFVDIDADDFHLTSVSPCINAGTGTPGGTDIDGETRASNTVEMGADEFLECLSIDANEYDDWVDWDRPDCWCYERQCRGDADGTYILVELAKIWVNEDDWDIFSSAYGKTEAELVTIEDGICADFNHVKFITTRVTVADLTIIKDYEDLPEPNVPPCDEEPIITGPYNFWIEP